MNSYCCSTIKSFDLFFVCNKLPLTYKVPLEKVIIKYTAYIKSLFGKIYIYTFSLNVNRHFIYIKNFFTGKGGIPLKDDHQISVLE